MTKKKKITLAAIGVILIAVITLIALFFNSVRVFFVGSANIIAGSPRSDDLIMIGHRGYSSKYVDNTAEAFIAAAKHSSKGVETDVRVTKDNVLVLSHDSAAEFEDGTSLTVADSTYDELTAKPLKNEYNDDKVYLCTFRRYLEICKEYRLICFIEFKGTFTDELIIAAFTLAEEVYELNMCSLQSFSMDNLVRAHTLFPTLPIMLTFGQGDDKADYYRCLEYGFDIDMDYKIATKKMVNEFHAHNLRFAVWTCNTKLALNYGYWLGVDFIESDVY